MVSWCLDNKENKIGADQDIVPALKEYINSVSARLIMWSTRMEPG